MSRRVILGLLLTFPVDDGEDERNREVLLSDAGNTPTTTTINIATRAQWREPVTFVWLKAAWLQLSDKYEPQSHPIIPIMMTKYYPLATKLTSDANQQPIAFPSAYGGDTCRHTSQQNTTTNKQRA